MKMGYACLGLWFTGQSSEPDVIFYDNNTDEYIFMDCSPESPKGSRSICYDREALEGRKENKPNNSAELYYSARGLRGALRV